MFDEADGDYVEQTPQDDGLVDVEVIVNKERQYQQELLQVLKWKEDEHKGLRQELGEIKCKIEQIQLKYEIPMVDPYLREYIQELGEQQLFDLESQRQELKGEKQGKIEQLRQLQQAKNQIKLFFTQTEISSYLQISYKNMLENLNQELFQYMQERADLEDEQFSFDKRLKSLRSQIREVTEKNQKIIQQIENSKQIE
ncbi:unnamed protein product (macronuclear) [Paramecium tetraurelia]|uniref:DUF4201 domain-containing protein n=1 Tax=Paramecium tetraurelia TaxID=5888 RepID=A0BU98_PARTE|nr:uncharacterized protein GSPATT00032347001 [Paramecium tetraurelia]CAK62115.1 unnamed protein product [Paramecium tetraurelia]|eukprot:XP_001429513.1 hypothetical protein (macronuclear) [Paramecium tetraurelia strain d4-2]